MGITEGMSANSSFVGANSNDWSTLSGIFEHIHEKSHSIARNARARSVDKTISFSIFGRTGGLRRKKATKCQHIVGRRLPLLEVIIIGLLSRALESKTRLIAEFAQPISKTKFPDQRLRTQYGNGTACTPQRFSTVYRATRLAQR